MIFDWFKKKEKYSDLPDFWREYSDKFEKKRPEKIEDTRFVVFDTETTGFDFDDDRILSIGAVNVQNKSIEIKDNFEIFLQQDKFNPETVQIHGIIRNEKVNKLSEYEALQKFIEYIEDSVLVAHHAGFDLKMINNALNRQGLPKLKNSILDTAVLYKKTRIISNFIDREKIYSLDEIAEAYNFDLSDRHTASGDAYITALILMRLLGKYYKSKDLRLKDLLKYKV
ncbi:3'-5' exonuclease [Christiangramia salexigens]|uniref:DNA polymerase III subunit epsilon n=1 Tax=Christiangramia salexigens TaxID=1913577 RepID=A0A1L3J2K9_9FLAO|nr:3'-5' exonuclease [Christiangramia salexigens]APG59357.1 DNA polymerase III subunit epsilon [Christiangramia salexigens]